MLRGTSIGKAAVAVAASLLLAGCGGAEAGGGALAEAAERMGDISSADMSLELSVSADEGAPVGFIVSGPYSVAQEGALPVADVTVERMLGEASSTTRFISTGDAAFVEVDGAAYELPEDRVAGMVGGPEGEGESLFEGIDISDWVEDETTKEGGRVDGVATTTVSGDLDVRAAFGDLFELGRQMGGALPDMDDETAEQLENAVESASIEMIVGEEDGFVRELRIDVALAAELPEGMSGLAIPGAALVLELTLADINEEVTVEAPADALPIEELEEAS